MFGFWAWVHESDGCFPPESASGKKYLEKNSSFFEKPLDKCEKKNIIIVTVIVIEVLA